MRIAVKRQRPVSLASAGKLFVTGATVGPVVDSIHNRCLLQYDYAPVNLEPFFHSSWIIPPLLGVSYVILGMILPRAVRRLLPESSSEKGDEWKVPSQSRAKEEEDEPFLAMRASQAVVSTILIIVLSLSLETTRTGSGAADPMILGLLPSNTFTNLLIMTLAALGQWSWLDRTPTSLVSAVLAALLGPLCELPLCAHGLWHYLPQASDYYPLEGLLEGLQNGDGVATGPAHFVSDLVLGNDCDPRDLGLASITGPCYFAVTTDAIALGRWFDAQQPPYEQPLSSAGTIDWN